MTLRARANLLRRVRDFFAERDVVEIQAPVTQGGPNLDRGISPVAVPALGDHRWLITSPEHHLKRVVAAYGCACYALTPVFRAGEVGRWHAPEFHMLEWYEPGFDLRRLARETLDLFNEMPGMAVEAEYTAWDDVFATTTGLDSEQASCDDLRDLLADVAPSAALDHHDLIELAWSQRVQPTLGHGHWSVVTAFPANAAAQAVVQHDASGRAIAQRFEIYRDGIELANGYEECTDGAEITRRFRAEAKAQGISDLDEAYLAALEAGLPPCAGVAVGWDRLVALTLGKDDLASVLL